MLLLDAQREHIGIFQSKAKPHGPASKRGQVIVCALFFRQAVV